MKLLLVDDEIHLLRLIEQLLQNAGYEVQSVENGRDGWKLFEQESWDAVIVDRVMPEMGGEELGRMIKAQSPQVPVIMITGLPEAVADSQLFDFILAKPFRLADLLVCLSRTLRKYA